MDRDEPVIKTRLSINERPLRRLTGRFYKWATSLSTGTPDEIEDGLQSFLLEVSQFQVGLSRSKLISEMAQRERIQHDKDQQNIIANIQEAEQELEILSIRLEEAKQERANKIQYDRIATDLLQYPSRESSQLSISQLKIEILELEKEAMQQSLVMELRKKQFFTALMCLQSIQESIEEDQREEATRLFHKRTTHDDDDDDENDVNSNTDGENKASLGDGREEPEEGGIVESMEGVALTNSTSTNPSTPRASSAANGSSDSLHPLSSSQPMRPSSSSQGSLAVDTKSQGTASPALSAANTPHHYENSIAGDDEEEGSVYSVNLSESSLSAGVQAQSSPLGRTFPQSQQSQRPSSSTPPSRSVTGTPNLGDSSMNIDTF